ncbi:hypothetical protein C8Q72DRAFT_823340 [Fomitopsis betulina]|nr:hypothetical protein C8Q72DRAFT_823340 [Fomitopsis betulina]
MPSMHWPGNIIIPIPEHMPVTIHKGTKSIWSKAQMTFEQLKDLGDLVTRSALMHLDETKSVTFQDPESLERHYKQVTRVWELKNVYEDDWPVKRYTYVHLREKAKIHQLKIRKNRSEGGTRQAQNVSTASGSHSTDKGPEAVRRALRSCHPPVPTSTIDSIIGLGIKDLGRLKDLAGHPESEWRSWMDRYIDLDTWELWTLKRALAKVASR